MIFELRAQEATSTMNLSNCSTPSAIRLLIIVVLILHQSDGFTAGIGANVPGRKRSEVEVRLSELRCYEPSFN